MGTYAIEDFPAEVGRFENLEDSHALGRVQPFIRNELAEGILSGVSEGGVADVVRQADRLCQVFIQR